MKRAKVIFTYRDISRFLAEDTDNPIDVRVIGAYNNQEQGYISILLEGEDLPVDEYVEGSEAPILT